MLFYLCGKIGKIGNYNCSMDKYKNFRKRLKTCEKCGRIHSGAVCKSARKYKRFEKSDNYNQVIKSYDWQRKSKEIKALDKYSCLVCRDIGMVHAGALEVHHMVKVNDDISLSFENGNLITLCPAHHRDADFNNISKDYLIYLIEKYRNDDSNDDSNDDMIVSI